MSSLADVYVQFSARGAGLLTSQLEKVRAAIGSVARTAMTFAAPVAGLFALGKGFSTAAELEQMEVALSTMTGSAEKGKKTLANLRKFAAQTPFQFPDVAQAGRMLLSYGTSAEELIPTLKAVGDVAAGIGAPIGEIAAIYGKAQSQGRLFMDDINQLAGRGIPVISELAKIFGVSESQVRELVSSGQVGFQHLQQVFQNLTSQGGRFANLMAAQSQTLAGLWSTLKDNIGMLLADIAQAIIEVFDIKGAMGSAISGFDAVRQWIVAAVRGILQAIRTMAEILRPPLRALFNLFSALAEAIAGMWTSLTSGMGSGWGFTQMLQSWAQWLADLWNEAAFLVRNWDVTWRLLWEKTKLFFSNLVERIKTWGINFAEVLGWVFRNWREIFTDIWNLGKTIFWNLIENIKNLWNALWDWIRGKGFNFNWKPLTQGFRSAVKEQLKLTKANVKETTAAIQKLEAELARRRTQQLNRQEAAEPTPKPPAATPAKLPASRKPPAGAVQPTQPALSGKLGLTEVIGKLQAAVMDNWQKQMQKATQTTAKATQELAKKATGEGIKVQVVNPQPATFS